MEQAQHTPGPWDILPLAHCQTVQAGPNNRICSIWDHVEHEGAPCGSIESQNKTQEEIDANVRLIAVAPELLEALKACVFQMNQYRPKTKDGLDWDWGDTVLFADKVIAKAMGSD